MIKEKIGRWGPCSYFARDEYVGRSIHFLGEYNREETDKILELRRLAGPGKTLDIGANIGSISQALIWHGYNVLAFEPQPEVFKLCAKNMAAAWRDSGENPDVVYGVMNAAVGNQAGLVQMPKVYYSERGNFGGLGIGTKSIYGNIDVTCIRLDDLPLDERVCLIKLDVEGYELEALRGMQETIRRDRPILYVEDDRVQNTVALRSFIRDLGYTITEHQPPLFSKDNFFDCEKSPWDRNFVSHNIICMPNA